MEKINVAKSVDGGQLPPCPQALGAVFSSAPSYSETMGPMQNDS